MEKLLEISNLSISFTHFDGLNKEEINIVKNLSLDVKKNEILSILGSSGAGKSLLAHAVLDILPKNAITTGTIKFKGEELNSKNIDKYRGTDISLIPQSINFLNPLMKIKNQVIGFQGNKSVEKEKISICKEIFRKYGLNEEVGNLYPFQLSGGMVRKVLISIALLNNPELIIADEPTPGLDIKSVDEAINDLIQLKNKGLGIILITHDIITAIKASDKIGILYGGYLIEISDSKNFSGNCKNLYHPYTKALYKALPEVEFKLTLEEQPSVNDNYFCPYIENCNYKTEICYKETPKLKKVNHSLVMCHNPLVRCDDCD